MNILALTRLATKLEDDEIPDLATYQAEQPPADASARGPHYYAGISRAALDVMVEAELAAGITYERIVIQSAPPVRPIGPVPTTDKLDALLAEFRTLLAGWDNVVNAAGQAALPIVVEATAALDRIANPLVLAQHMLFVPLFEELRDVEREFVDGVAEWIQAKADLAELHAAPKETGAEATV